MSKEPTHKTLADALMRRTLQRAHDGVLKRGEAQNTLALMQAFESWSNASQRSELVEQGQQIVALAEELKAREVDPPTDLIARTKTAVRDAVASAVRETMTQELGKPNGRRPRRAASSKS